MKKSKWDILGKDIHKDNQLDHDEWFYYWYDGEDYHDYYDGSDYFYDYSDPVYNEYISKRGIRVSIEKINTGSYIDMMSIYSTQYLRQRKIDYLLGIDKWDIQKTPTIGDLLKNNENNEN